MCKKQCKMFEKLVENLYKTVWPILKTGVLIIIVNEMGRFWDRKAEAALCTWNRKTLTCLFHLFIINNIPAFKYTVYTHFYTHFSSSL